MTVSSGRMGNKEGKIVVTDDIVDQISHSSGIASDQVKQQCQNFLKEYPSGAMTREKICDSGYLIRALMLF